MTSFKEIDHRMPEILSESQIDDMLYHQIYGRLGCCANGKVYIVPINFAYDGKYIYAHSKESLKIEIMRCNSKVCFEIDCLDKSGSWKSVIVWGDYEELKTINEQSAAMKIFIGRMAKLVEVESAMPTHGQVRGERKEKDPFKAIVFRIAITEKTGRCDVRGVLD